MPPPPAAEARAVDLVETAGNEGTKVAARICSAIDADEPEAITNTRFSSARDTSAGTVAMAPAPKTILCGIVSTTKPGVGTCPPWPADRDRHSPPRSLHAAIYPAMDVGAE